MTLTGPARCMTAPCVTCVSRWMKSILRDASARLSVPVARLKRGHEFSFGVGQVELKYSTARLVRLRPQLAPMSMDDGAAYRQPHACSTGLRGVEGVEDLIEMRRINSGPGIAHGHEDACPVLLGADHQVPCPRLYRAHCFSSIQNEVQQDLLQLNAISLNGKQSVRKPGLDRNATPEGHALCQYDHFVDCRVEIKTLLSRRRFLDLLSNAIDDFCG